MANLKGVIIVFLVSSTSWPLLYLLSKYPQVTEPSVLLPVGCVVLLVTFWILSKSLGKGTRDTTTQHANVNIKPRGIMYYTCALFSWTCMVDLVLFLEAVGIIHGFMGFYLENGEKYFNEPYGIIALLLDFVLNLPLFLTIIYQIDNKLDCRNVVVFYGASNLSSMTCLFFGALTGSYGKEILPSTWLNIPYFILPTFFLLQFLTQPRHDGLNEPSASRKTLFDYLLGLGLIFSVIFGGIQGLAALNSPAPIAQWYLKHEPYLLEPTKFGAIWPIFSLFGVSFIRILIIFGLFQKSTNWLKDWSLIYLAITFDGVSKHLGAQFFPRLASEYQIPSNSMKLVIFFNLIPLIVAVCLFYRAFCTPKTTMLKSKRP